MTIVRFSGPLHQKSCKQTTLSTLAVRNVITKQQRDLRVDLEIMVSVGADLPNIESPSFAYYSIVENWLIKNKSANY